MKLTREGIDVLKIYQVFNILNSCNKVNSKIKKALKKVETLPLLSSCDNHLRSQEMQQVEDSLIR